MARTFSLFLALAAGLCLPQLAFAFIVYKVGGGADCPYANIQDAVDAAAANPGTDYVWIAMDQAYTDQHVVVSDQDVIIEGGFTDCDDNDPGSDQTTINGTSGHSVFEIEGNANVYLGNLVITGAVMDSSHSGGGIYFGGAGGLTLQNSWVFNNQAGYGGGIDVSPSGPTTLDMFATTVSGNTALVSGGGIRIEGPTVLNATHSSSQFNIFIAQNAALGQGEIGYGGGVEVLGPAVANISGVVDLNSAPYGGGIAALATGGGSAFVNLFTTDPANPVSIYGNVAQQTGGGIFLKPLSDNFANAKLCAEDFAIDANTAINGAAIYADQDNGLGSSAFLNSAGCDPPPGSLACAPGTVCNEINDNIAGNGATVLIQSDGALSANRFAARGNQGSEVIWFVSDTGNINGGGDYVYLHDCLLVGNSVTGDLILGLGSNAIGASETQIVVDSCTIAGNQYAPPAPPFPPSPVILGEVDFLVVTNSIIYDPTQPPMFFTGPDLTAGYVLTNEIDQFQGGTGVVSGVPLFVDAANGDYHLMLNSPGVDFAPAIDGVDLDGNPRTVDLPGVPNTYGPLDLGAYEIQNTGTDMIYRDGFDGP